MELETKMEIKIELKINIEFETELREEPTEEIKHEEEASKQELEIEKGIQAEQTDQVEIRIELAIGTKEYPIKVEQEGHKEALEPRLVIKEIIEGIPQENMAREAKIVVIKDVRHIPDIRLNLISARRLDDKGYCGSFRNGSWKFCRGNLIMEP